MKLWVGKEEEGVHKGLITLFVASPTITMADIQKAIEHFKIKQIYFGAGLCSDINKNIVRECLQTLKPWLITLTLEIDIDKLEKYQDLFKETRLEFIISTTNKNYSLLNNINENKIQIKVQSLVGDKVVALSDWKKFIKANMKRLEEKKYKLDEVLK